MEGRILVLFALFSAGLVILRLVRTVRPRATVVLRSLVLILTVSSFAVIPGSQAKIERADLLANSGTVLQAEQTRRMRSRSHTGRYSGVGPLSDRTEKAFDLGVIVQVRSWEEVYAALVENSRTRSEKILLAWSGELNLREDYDRLNTMIYSTGVREFSWSFRNYVVVLDDLRYYDCFSVCSTREEALAFVEECANNNDKDFRLYFYPELARDLFSNERAALNRMLSETRIVYPSRYSYSENGRYVVFSDVNYYDAPLKYYGSADSLARFIEIMTEHTNDLEESFEICVGEGMKKTLRTESGIGPEGCTLLTDLCINLGVSHFEFYWSGSILGFKNLQYYEGKRILYASRSGQTSMLTDRERRTLDEALRIASSASGTDLEKERMIHDALCARITYYTDHESHNANDCAIGALLNGLADCDGYSDAFYLCCNLAGIQTVHQHGDVYQEEKDANPDKKEATHMWNQVKINGIWVHTDITWDDTDTGISYMYFNVGSRQMGKTHFWNEDAATVSSEENTLNNLRNPDIIWKYADDWDGLYDILRDASTLKSGRICLLTPSDMDLRTNTDRFAQMIYSTGVVDYSWHFSKAGAELSGIEYAARFAICSSEAEVLSFAEECAEAGSREFRVYFSPELAQKLFADDRRELHALLVQTRLKKPFAYGYSEYSGMIEFQDMEFETEAAKLFAARTWDEIYAVLAENSRVQAGRVAINWSGAEDLRENSEKLGYMICSTGVSDYAWSFRRNIVLLFDLRYYSDFAICSTEAEVRAFLRTCAASRKSEFRIYCSTQELYDTLHQNYASSFFSLLEQAGCVKQSVSHSDETRMLLVREAQW